MYSGIKKASWPLVAATLSIFLVATLLLVDANIAQADEMEWTGVIDARPQNGMSGDWVIGGKTFTADAATAFEYDDGPLEAGACADVSYVVNDGVNRATEIESEEPAECGGDDDAPGESKFYGLIEVVPPDYDDGVWTIGGQAFVATAATEFDDDDDDDPFIPGVCAEVEYYDDSGVFIATSIETTEPYHCNNGGNYTNEVYGRIDSFPANLYGTWIVDGVPYAATGGVTEFEQEDGSFAIGACVQIEYYTIDGVNQAVEIESEDDEDDCGEDGGSESYNKLYAIINDFPPYPHTGSWTLGGAVYTATAATEFEQEDGSFAVGACVEAKYQIPGRFLTEVETEEAYKCQNQDDGGDENTAYGVVEQLPSPTYLGDWQVSGVSYLADTNTIFEQEYGFFSVGAYVEVKYVLSGTTRLATKIETHVAPDSGLQNVYGTLENYDPNDEWADWTVDGLVYQADPAINVGVGEKAPQIGERIRLNTYQIPNGGSYVTYAERLLLDQNVYLPVATR